MRGNGVMHMRHDMHARGASDDGREGAHLQHPAGTYECIAAAEVHRGRGMAMWYGWPFDPVDDLAPLDHHKASFASQQPAITALLAERVERHVLWIETARVPMWAIAVHDDARARSASRCQPTRQDGGIYCALCNRTPRLALRHYRFAVIPSFPSACEPIYVTAAWWAPRIDICRRPRPLQQQQQQQQLPQACAQQCKRTRRRKGPNVGAQRPRMDRTASCPHSLGTRDIESTFEPHPEQEPSFGSVLRFTPTTSYEVVPEHVGGRLTQYRVRWPSCRAAADDRHHPDGIDLCSLAVYLSRDGERVLDPPMLRWNGALGDLECQLNAIADPALLVHAILCFCPMVRCSGARPLLPLHTSDRSCLPPPPPI